MKWFLVAIFFSLYGCMPLTTNSQAFRNVQTGLLENTKTLDKVAEKLDFVTEKLGVEGTKKVSDETKELIAQIQKDNEIKYNALQESVKGLMPLLKVVAPIAGQAIGIPSQVTNAGISITDALLGGGSAIGALTTATTLWARRKRESEHQEELEGLEKEKDEKIRKLKIERLAMAYTNPEHQEEHTRNMERAEKELRSKGEI